MLLKKLKFLKNLFSNKAYLNFKNETKNIKKEYSLTDRELDPKYIHNSKAYFYFRQGLNVIYLLFFKRSLNNNHYSLKKQYLGSVYGFLRKIIILLLKILDPYFHLPYGNLNNLNYPKTLYYGNLKLITFPKSKGIDLRSNIWKRDALSILLELVKSKDYLHTFKKFSFLEIGAASGLVSLFFGKFLCSKNVNYNITCIEPNFDNILFLEETAKNNNLDIKIIPFAIGDENKWVEFSNVTSKGLVGRKAVKLDKNYEKSMKLIKPMITANFLSNYISDIDICYLDTLHNEGIILKVMLEKYKNIKFFLIEFDPTPTKEINDLLKSNSYFLKLTSKSLFLYEKKER